MLATSVPCKSFDPLDADTMFGGEDDVLRVMGSDRYVVFCTEAKMFNFGLI